MVFCALEISGEKKMENNQIRLYQKMGVLDILINALLIPSKNINFIIFTFITSLPLFCFLVYYEFSFQMFLLETFEILKESTGYYPFFDVVRKLKKDYLQELTQLGFLYLVPLHLLELSTVLVTVDLASKIYKEDRSMSLKDMVKKPMINMERLRGILITFIYVTFLSTCTRLGLIWLVTVSNVFSNHYIYSVFNLVVHGGTFVAILTLCLASSAVWNMSVVVSILEGVYGTQALALSSYYCRGKDGCGIILMLVFFVWEIGLRFPCLYIGCYEGGYGIFAQISLFCLGNTLKWVVFVVYLHNCKERTLEKKVDEEVEIQVRVVG